MMTLGSLLIFPVGIRSNRTGIGIWAQSFGHRVCSSGHLTDISHLVSVLSPVSYQTPRLADCVLSGTIIIKHQIKNDPWIFGLYSEYLSL
jgi:hypothetical protein